MWIREKFLKRKGVMQKKLRNLNVRLKELGKIDLKKRR